MIRFGWKVLATGEICQDSVTLTRDSLFERSGFGAVNVDQPIKGFLAVPVKKMPNGQWIDATVQTKPGLAKCCKSCRLWFSSRIPGGDIATGNGRCVFDATTCSLRVVGPDAGERCANFCSYERFYEEATSVLVGGDELEYLTRPDLSDTYPLATERPLVTVFRFFSGSEITDEDITVLEDLAGFSRAEYERSYVYRDTQGSLPCYNAMWNLRRRSDKRAPTQ